MNLQRVDTGYKVDNVLSMEIPLSRGRCTPAEIRGFYETIERRTQELPGVVAAAMTSQIPLGGAPILFEVGVDGFLLDPDASVPRADYRAVSPDYFDVSHRGRSPRPSRSAQPFSPPWSQLKNRCVGRPGGCLMSLGSRIVMWGPVSAASPVGPRSFPNLVPLNVAARL